jgi:tRNA threonylcarbamoyladenosine biosynthesis protein TsaB
VLVLAIDTSTTVASVGLYEGGEVLAELDGPAEAKHGEALLSVVEAALGRAGRTVSQVALIAVGIGPGSFTGVRVGLATAKGIALGTGKPLVGVVSLGAMGQPPREAGGFVAPVLDAYRNEVYAALYRRDERGTLTEVVAPFNREPAQAAERLAKAAAGAPVVLCGNGARRYEHYFAESLGSTMRWAEPRFDTPRASVLARQALLAYDTSGPSDLLALEPFYLRPSDAQLTG